MICILAGINLFGLFNRRKYFTIKTSTTGYKESCDKVNERVSDNNPWKNITIPLIS